MLGGLTKARFGSAAPRDEAVPGPYPLADAALAVAAFTFVFAGLGLFAGTLIAGDAESLTGFFGRNELELDTRRSLFLALALGALAGLFGALTGLAIGGRRAVATLTRGAQISLPAGVFLVLPSLFVAKPWHDAPLPYLVGLAATVLLFELALVRSASALPPGLTDALGERLAPLLRSRRLPLLVVMAGSVFYAVYFSYYTILNHQRLNTWSYDLGINVNWCYNALYGHFWRSSVLTGPDGGHFLGNHAIFAMALWLPIYAISPGAEVLLIVQATTAGLAAIPLYLFAATQIPKWPAAVVAYAYLFFAPLHGPNFYDYHELLPPLGVHFLLYWALATKRNWLAALLVPLLWSFREDMAVGLVVLGAFLVVSGARPKAGGLIAGASLLWFCLIKFVIMPRYSGGWFDEIYKDLQVPERPGYAGVVQTILVNPAYFLSTLLTEKKLVYFLHFFAPLALLPLRRPVLFLLAIPGFAFSLLTTGYDPTLSIGFQYTCHSIPYVFAASVLALRVLGAGVDGRLRQRAATAAVALGAASHSFVFGAILQHETFKGGDTPIRFEITEQERERYEKLTTMASRIPVEASVSATDTEVAHIATRMDAYTMKDHPIPAEYVLVNRRRKPPRGDLVEMLRGGDYRLIDSGHGLYLFQADLGSTPATERAFNVLDTNRGKKKRRKSDESESE